MTALGHIDEAAKEGILAAQALGCRAAAGLHRADVKIVTS
jgi:hypothetical protein